MDLRNLPLSALKAFEAVGRHCHIRKAAAEMHVSHPALSRHVRQLEERLGLSLFTRTGNRLELTAAGRRLLTSVQSAFAELSKGLLYLDPENVAGEIVIASTATIYINWLMPILRDFQKQYPEIQLRLKTIEPRQHKLSIEYDLAICLGEPDERVKSVWLLYHERYMPVCSPQLMPPKSLRKASELFAYPLMHDNMDHWKKWFLSHELDHLDAKQNTYFDYAYQAIEAARLGMGVALADQMEVQHDIQTGRLVSVFEYVSTVSQSVYLVADDVNRQNQRVQLVIALLIDTLRANNIALDDKVLSLVRRQ